MQMNATLGNKAFGYPGKKTLLASPKRTKK